MPPERLPRRSDLSVTCDACAGPFPIPRPSGVQKDAPLAVRLDAMPGVIDHGLFVGLAHTLVVGRSDGTAVIERNT